MSNEVIFDRMRIRPGELGATRISNRAWVLGLIRESGDSHRGTLVDKTGLSKSLVASIVSDLIARGLVVEESAPGRSTGAGRPPTQLLAVLPSVLLCAVRFEQSRLQVVIADCAMTLLDHRRSHIDLRDDPTGLVDLAVTLLRDALTYLGVAESAVDAIVVSLPGPIDRKDGSVRAPSVLTSWAGVDVAGLFAHRLRRPVHVENDANLGAWGEHTAGAGYGIDDFLYLEVSNGIGAGIMLDGRVYRGSAGVSGEIGHTQVDPSGPLCRCGQHGCVEVIAAAGRVREKLRLIGGSNGEGERSFDKPDGVMRRVLVEAGYTLGKVVAGACNLLNPQAIIIGGEMGANPPYIQGVEEAIRRYVQPVVADGIEVIAGGLGREAVVVGALARAVQLVRAHEAAIEREGGALLHSGEPRFIVRGRYADSIAGTVTGTSSGLLIQLRSTADDKFPPVVSNSTHEERPLVT